MTDRRNTAIEQDRNTPVLFRRHNFQIRQSLDKLLYSYHSREGHRDLRIVLEGIAGNHHPNPKFAVLHLLSDLKWRFPTWPSQSLRRWARRRGINGAISPAPICDDL